MLRQIFARNLKTFRKAAGLSQEDLAHLAHIDQTYLSRLECGRNSVSADVLEDIARALEIEPAELLRKRG